MKIGMDNHRAGVDAGRPVLFAFGRQRSGTTHRGRQAEYKTMNNNQHLRPPQVNLASSLLVLYWAFGLVKVLLGRFPQTIYISAAVFLSFFGALILCIWLISRGTNWARWLFLAWFVWNCFFSPWSLQHLSPRPAMGAIYSSVQLMSQLVALALLFLPTANRWFRGHVRSAITPEHINHNYPDLTPP